MQVVRPILLLICLLISTFSLSQEIRPESNSANSSTNGFLTGPPANPGAYTDGPGFRFFQMLRGAVQYRERPATFNEVIEQSSVIARGNLLEVIPGRSISSTVAPGTPPLSTIFLKIVPSSVLKGAREDYYLVETSGNIQMVRELNEKLFLGELLFLLRPAGNIYANPEISLWPGAQIEFNNGKPLYDLAKRSMLFTISGTGRLASPLDAPRRYSDLYTNIQSLEELESQINGIQATQASQDGEIEGGSRQWGETELVEVEREQGLVRYWYDSGELQAEVNFDNGEANGPAKYWFENGQLALDAIYEDGQRVECQAWAEDGSPTHCP